LDFKYQDVGYRTKNGGFVLFGDTRDVFALLQALGVLKAQVEFF